MKLLLHGLLLVGSVVALNNLTDAGFFCLTSETVNEFQTVAVFKCCHVGPVRDYSWSINGIPYRTYSNVLRSYCGACHDGCIRTSALTVPAVPEYNGANVACIVSFNNGSLLSSDNFTLQVNSENASQDFLEAPRSTCAPNGTTAYLFCGLNRSAEIEWRVNNTSLQDSNLRSSVHSVGRRHTDESYSVLVVNTSSINSGFTVQCQERGNTCILTPPIQFRIQGRLEAPTDLNCIAVGNDVVCDGTQRYSRNLTERNYEHLRSYDIDPKIRFCACVTNLTCGGTMLRPACQITRLPFTLYGQNNSPFRVTVTPLNNSNATPAEFEEIYAGMNCEQDLTDMSYTESDGTSQVTRSNGVTSIVDSVSVVGVLGLITATVGISIIL